MWQMVTDLLQDLAIVLLALAIIYHVTRGRHQP